MSDFINVTDITQFTFQAYKGVKYKTWDTSEGKSKFTDEPINNYSKKIHGIESDKGTFSVADRKFMELLALVVDETGTASLAGKTFSVKVENKAFDKNGQTIQWKDPMFTLTDGAADDGGEDDSVDIADLPF